MGVKRQPESATLILYPMVPDLYFPIWVGVLWVALRADLCCNNCQHHPKHILPPKKFFYSSDPIEHSVYFYFITTPSRLGRIIVNVCNLLVESSP